MLPIAQLPAPPPLLRAAPEQQGDHVVIAGQTLQTAWIWRGGGADQPAELWLTLEVLETQLGFHRSESNGQAQLEWFGRRAQLGALPTKTLGDEVGINVAKWLRDVGVELKRQGARLELTLPRPRLQRLRQGKGSTADRLVLDLNGPVFVQRQGNDLLLDLQSSRRQQNELKRLGLAPLQTASGLRLKGQAPRLRSLTLATPWRVVLDGVKHQSGRSNVALSAPTALPLTDPALAALVRRGLVLDRRRIRVGVKPLEILRAGGELDHLGLSLMPLPMAGPQQGLRYLNQLAAPAGALVAVNGGFFNRIQQLPLGALRLRGMWLSGPILNRGVVAWETGKTPEFGRLRLDQELRVQGGRRWGLGFLNSGYVQRGLSRYTAAWGPMYRSLSGGEEAILLQDGTVTATYSTDQLRRGVLLPRHGDLIVARGRAPLPAGVGERATVKERVSNPVGRLPNVLGGGPLLMQAGRVVLNGRGEGFSPGFVAQTAPRTVVGHGRGGTWLLTVRSAGAGGPSLLETALAAQQLGLRDALNLDGGSSTTMLAAGRTLMTGSSSSPRIHNGLGLVPQPALPLW